MGRTKQEPRAWREEGRGWYLRTYETFRPFVGLDPEGVWNLEKEIEKGFKSVVA
jgi:hypothetical protein